MNLLGQRVHERSQATATFLARALSRLTNSRYTVQREKRKDAGPELRTLVASSENQMKLPEISWALIACLVRPFEFFFGPK